MSSESARGYAFGFTSAIVDIFFEWKLVPLDGEASQILRSLAILVNVDASKLQAYHDSTRHEVNTPPRKSPEIDWLPVSV